MNWPIPSRREPTDEQMEAIVAAAMAAESADARQEAAPPSAAIVWWRAQMRARQEAARAVERPLTIVHALAIACCIGLFVSTVGVAVAGLKGSFGWLGGIYTALATGAAVDLTGRWIMVPMTAMIISIVIASIAALVIFADE